MEADTSGNRQPAEAPSHSPYTNGLHLNTTDTAPYGSRSRLSDAVSPMSAPTTPNLKTSHSRRTSQTATSPIPYAASPRTQSAHRPSSSASMHRQSSSPNPKLARKSSRSSLGGAPEDSERRPTPKRSISNLVAGLREAHSTMESIEEPIPLTAPQIATEHFARELLSHAQQDVESQTVVILHDACYGHRYSRLKATKTTLSMIVERPERIHASILGASAAYVRLGGHHASAKNAPHPGRVSRSKPLFKIRRSTRALDITSSFVTNVHGTAWMSELQCLCRAAGEKISSGLKELSRSVNPGEPEPKKLHEGDLYLASQSLDAFQGALGGVADAVDAVFGTSHISRAFVAVRPPGHHCSTDYPSGFCWVNNVHVGIEYAAQTYGLTHAAILDFDLHHGDGSQAITWERNSKNNVKRLNAKPTSKLKLSPDVGYYSIHDINSYPCEGGDDEKVQAASLCIENAHGQSIWNVHLQPWKSEADFWRLYEERYCVLLEKARAFLRQHASRIVRENKAVPKAAIFISAGFDASEWEGSGMQRHKVNVPTEFYARFTEDTVKLSQEAATACDGRVISVLEGGYSDRALCSGVLSHLSGLCTTSSKQQLNGNEGLAGLSDRLGDLSLSGLQAVAEEGPKYDKDWWSATNLTALENKVNPPPPPQTKKVRTGPQPTYATPTESFAYKVIDTNKFAKSISGTMRDAPKPIRAPTPPPPEVDWVVATQELSKLLIPTERQTKSCTPEELAGPRIKKERESMAPLIPPRDGAQSRQLRDRRGKATDLTEGARGDDPDAVRSVSRSSRRETIDVLPSEQSHPAPARRVSRRLSAGSTLGIETPTIDPQPPPIPSLPKSSKHMPPPPPPQAGLDIKKTRAPSKARKVETVPSKASALSTDSVKLSPASTGVSSSDNSQSSSATHMLDSLTSGMKKVTLKVSSSREEHDRKQREKVDAERRERALKGAETRRVNAAAKKAAVSKQNSGPSSANQIPTPLQDAAVPIVPAPGPPTALVAPATIVNPPAASRAQTTNSTPIELQAIVNAGAPIRGAAEEAVSLLDTSSSTVRGLDGESAPESLRPHSLEFPEYAINPFEIKAHASVPSAPAAAASMAQPATGQMIAPLPIDESQGPLQPQASNVIPLGPTMPQALKSPSRGSSLPVWSSNGPIPFAKSTQPPNGHIPIPRDEDGSATGSMQEDPLGAHFVRQANATTNGSSPRS